MELPNRPQLEADFALRLSRVSSRHRQELVRLLGNPPDPARVPQSFWAQVEHEEQQELFLMLLLLFMVSSEFHGFDGPDVRTMAQNFASTRSTQVAADYIATSQDRLNRLADGWRQRSVDTARGMGFPAETTRPFPLPPGEIDADALEVFGPDRDSNIAVTETTVAQSAGGEGAAEATGAASKDDLWITERDGLVCPVCRPLHREGRETWTRFFPSGPPAHPRCRCFIQYAEVTSPVEVNA